MSESKADSYSPAEVIPFIDCGLPLRRSPTPVRRAPNDSVIAPGKFAPITFEAGCVSRSGRARRRHELDADGRCLFCSFTDDDR
jgi:hypothetical protein